MRDIDFTMLSGEETVAHGQVVGGRVVLGDKVGRIGGTGGPEDEELALACPINQPVKAHVDGLGALHFGGAVDEANSSRVINHDGGGRLGMSEFGAGYANRTSFAGSLVRRTYLSLHGGAEHDPHDPAEDLDHAVPTGRGNRDAVDKVGCLSKVMDPTNAAARVRGGEVGGVALGG